MSAPDPDRCGPGPAFHPRQEYERRRELCAAACERWSRWEKALSISRLVVAVTGAVLLWLAVQSRLLSLAWVLLPAVVFTALVVWHDRVLRRRDASRRARDFYDAALARLEHRWMGQGETGERFHDPSHLYAADLDVFGPGSLFELLSTSRTRAGEETLARWLASPPSRPETLKRQVAVAELRGRLDLREEMALLGREVRVGLDPRALLEWARGCGPTGGRGGVRLTAVWLRLTLLVVAALNLLTAVGWGALGWGRVPLLTLLVLEASLSVVWRPRVAGALLGVDRASRDLSLFAQLLSCVEESTFSSPRLVALGEALRTGDVAPSRRIRRLATLVELLDSARNPFFAPLAVFVLWRSHVACAIESWRRKFGPAVARWLDAVGELEALMALAGYAYEHPRDTFPEIVEAGPEGPLLEAEGLGHPLLPEDRCVRNDVTLDQRCRALIVSGSNMSGKSTLLRTVGINVVLALAGAPVRARRLRLVPLRVGASLRIQDSLLEGSSRFYAEITRLRDILNLQASGDPVLFLLDEILHGTNSHDRRIGAEGILRALLERGAMGLVTTHDLALAKIAEDAAVAVLNVHFEDHLEDGRMVFDYRLRPGVVQHSNALALMREVGLEV